MSLPRRKNGEHSSAGLACACAASLPSLLTANVTLRVSNSDTAEQEDSMRIRYWSMIAIAMLAAAGTALAADSPWAGKWKMDASQSKLTGNTIHIASMGDDLVY